jgi:L-lactate dehydrogenase complex protein LldG
LIIVPLPLPCDLRLVSGPTRNGDIEQTLVLGAHFPYRVHILIVDR